MGPFRWVLLIIFLCVISFGAFWVMGPGSHQTGTLDSPMPPSREFLSNDTNRKDGEGEQQGKKTLDATFLLDDQSPEVKEEIQSWEERITLCAEDKAPEMPSQKKIHELAVYTVSLLRLLKAAKEREAAGLDPFTGTTGFNTMALVMTLEKDFEKYLGCPFIGFFESQDQDELKSLLKGE